MNEAATNELSSAVCLSAGRKCTGRTTSDDDADSRLEWKLITVIKVSLFDSLPL